MQVKTFLYLQKTKPGGILNKGFRGFSMVCCEFGLPKPFNWKIKAIGKAAELLLALRDIMSLPESSEIDADLTVIPRSEYDIIPKDKLSAFYVFYSRQAVRLFHDKENDKWLLVFPEDILNDRTIRVILMWLMLRPLYLRCLRNGGLPVHASSAECDGKAIIIVAAGDTGKTTTVRRLPPPWRELGDDAALLLPCSNGGFCLHPLPTWSEFIYGANPTISWSMKCGNKLAAVFFLKQAEYDKAEHLNSTHAMISLQQSAMEIIGELKEKLSVEHNLKTLDTASKIIQASSAFTLHATLDGRIWETINEKL